jgi:hypothetical protein
MINFDLASDSNFASWLGDTRIVLGCTALISTLPILVQPALRILAQTSLVFMRTVTFAALLLGRRFFVIASVLGMRFGSRCRRTGVVLGLSR